MSVVMIMDGKGVGGAELQFIELANHLVTRRPVRLVCLHAVNDVLKANLDPRVELSAFVYDSKMRSVPKLIEAMHFCRKQRAEYIITTSGIGDIIGALAKSGATRKLISLQTVSAPKRHPNLDKIALARHDRLVAGCGDIRDFLVTNGQPDAKIQVINNWVDFSNRDSVSDRAEIRRSLAIEPHHVMIGCIARMHHQKGQEFLIRAFAKLAGKCPDARLVLVGDGPRMEEMKDEAADVPNIVFTGTITGNEYNGMLHAFDIYVQPSRYEGLPRTLLDAMYMGLPVIATNANGMAEVIRDGKNGLSVPVGDVDAIARAIERLVEDGSLRTSLGEAAAVDALENYSMAVQMKKFDGLMAA